ncbi:hypothetical protein GBAR_LOCUS31368 [Geodia barretti]|uniref:Uncharacterized protein n=1 Tax=Geodia barretti TaxID=519541 RepID=A0AA35U2J4_GEOBA|nr:hypothetical protein GBAR_LOCUS31368 [Geodia barretti]
MAISMGVFPSSSTLTKLMSPPWTLAHRMAARSSVHTPWYRYCSGGRRRTKIEVWKQDGTQCRA